MNDVAAHRLLSVASAVLLLLGGNVAVVAPAGAQALEAVPDCPQAATSTGDAAIALRVRAALHSDRFFNDSHVEVSVEHGDVELNGFVLGDWDLLHAIRVSTLASCGRRVIDSLYVQQGGNR